MNSLVREVKSNDNAMLYAFLATNYDISNLASKIAAEKQAQRSIFNLKQMVSRNNDISA